MRYHITAGEYGRIESLVLQALSAPNKKEANRYIQQLRQIGYDLAGGARNVFSELCSSTEYASGRVSDKERRESFCRMDLYKIRGFIKSEDADSE